MRPSTSALVLERAAHERDGERVGLGGRMCEDEILAAGFADETRIRFVARDALADAAPDRLEDRRRAREMDAREIWMHNARIRDARAVAVHDVDDARRKTRRFEELHRVVRRERLILRGLPHDDVAHERAGVGRFPAIAVKLNGVTARTKPSSGRSSSELRKPSGEIGCSAMRDAKWTLKRKKSISSHAESISAW